VLSVEYIVIAFDIMISPYHTFRYHAIIFIVVLLVNIMVKNLIVRGFDDEIHARLGETAEKLGVSLNSIVKDAVDKWIKQSNQVPKRHDLILYSDDESLLHLLRSVDSITKEGGWFRSYSGAPSHPAVRLLEKMKWFDATVKPYNPNQKDLDVYCSKVVEKLSKATKQQVFCLDFILADIAAHSLKKATQIEHAYNESRVSGLMFCPYKIDTLLNANINDVMELFDSHDQIFILKQNEIYKLHTSRENIHKLFVS
jgi:hypothetical protein